MALNVFLLTAIGLKCSIGVSGFEMYSKDDMIVADSQILAKMENIKEVECILGCKSFGGCAFASFSMANQEKFTGKCSYYHYLRLESEPHVSTVTAYISK